MVFYTFTHFLKFNQNLTIFNKFLVMKSFRRNSVVNLLISHKFQTRLSFNMKMQATLFTKHELNFYAVSEEKEAGTCTVGGVSCLHNHL